MNKFNHRPGNVSGRITDRDNGEPLFGVNIAVADSEVQVKTDLRGRFFIPNLPPGECALQCTLPGYKPLPALKVTIVPGETVQHDCQLACKHMICLNEPLVLLPLRLEIRKVIPQTTQPVSVANYTQNTQNVTAALSGNSAPFQTKSEVKQLGFEKSEYWIRLYPDDIHHLTPIGKITAAEKTAWEEFNTVYKNHEDAGSVKGLYAQEKYNLSIETLETFYRVRPGRLTDDQAVRCDVYDEDARELIQTEGKGVREALGWQDTENPEIKAAWIEFTKAVGVARGRQVARHMLEDNWDFDNENETEEEPLDMLMNRGMSIGTLPEEISLYSIKNRNVERLVENISINQDALIIAPTDLEGTYWMTDFKKAVQEGMGIVISDPEEVKQIDQADWLIVVGVNTTPDSRIVLEEILRRNNATGEISILAQDSPTNNTEPVPTQYTELEPDAETYLRNTRLRIPEEVSPADPETQIAQNIPDSQRLTHVLKLSNSTLSEMPGAHFAEMTEATAMAALLWTPCTWLYQHLWGGLFNQAFPEMSRFLKQLKPGNFFVNHVRARGTLPIIRIAEIPYGIVPVISVRDWSKNLSRSAKVSVKDAEIIGEFIDSLKDRLLSLSQSAPKVDLATEDEKYETLLEILRTAPVARRVDVRPFDAETPTELSADPKYLNCLLVKDKAEGKEACIDTPYPETAYLCNFSHVNRDDFTPASFRIDNESPLLKRILKYFLELVYGDPKKPPNGEITGVVVDNVTGVVVPGATVSVGEAGITAKTDKKGKFVMADVPAGVHALEVNLGGYHVTKSTHVDVQPFVANRINFGLSPAGNPKSNIMSEQQPAIKAVHQPAGTIKGRMVDRNSGKAIAGGIVYLAGTGKSVVTDAQGEYTLAALPAGKHQITVSTSGYDTATFSATVSENAPTLEINTDLAPLTPGSVISPGSTIPLGPQIPGGLDLVAEAATLLKGVHPDKLEILLLETLDLFSHRLDAWLTGLANSVLEERQRQNTQPPPIGVYGWLEKPGKLDFKSVEPEFIQAPSVKQATTAAILRNASMHSGTDDNSGAFQINLSSEQIRKGTWYMEGLRQGHLPGELLGYRLERMIHEESRKPKSPIKEIDIFHLRDQYPLTLQETRDETDEATSTLTIIDGENFLNDEGTDPKFKEVKARLNRIKDAAADIAMCEVIDAHDNVARRGGWMDFLDGDALPPREEFIRSHRTGDVHGTKVVLPILPPEHLEADTSETNPRIIADPILAHFCETLMPDFETKEIVARLTQIGGDSTRPITFLVRELNIHPIDFVLGGVEEIQLRIRYYLLSCWRANDPTDKSSASPCNILGLFPDFEQSDELLNEVGVELVPPPSSKDTLSIFNCIGKAKLIRNLIHQNRAKNGLGTVPPEDISVVTQEQLDHLDPLAGLEILAKRSRRIRVQLIRLIATTVEATATLKRRHLILRGLFKCQRCLRKIKDGLGSKPNDIDVDDIIKQLRATVNNLIGTDPDFKDLAENAQILTQIDQIANGDNNFAETIENLRTHFSDLEKQFRVYVENTAKALVASPTLPLLEISRFGLEKALTIFPEGPTVAASAKILKLFDEIVASLAQKLHPLISDSPDLQNYLRCLEIFYLNAGEISEILNVNQHDEAAANEQLRNRLPLTEEQSQIIAAEAFATTNCFDPQLNSLLENINTSTQTATYYEDYLVSAAIALMDDPEGVYNIVTKPTANVLERIRNTYEVTERQAEIIMGFNLHDIGEFDERGVGELIVSTTNSKITEIISHLQAATDKEGMVILMPYLLRGVNEQRPDWTLDLSELASLSGTGYLEEYQKVRPAIANLFGLFKVGAELRVYEDRRYQRLDPEGMTQKKQGNTDYLYLTRPIGSLLEVKCLTFLLIDQWQEGIPNPDQSEITGVTLRYESPQAEAPNAILIAVPPYKSNTEYWETDLLANTLLETIELMQIRLVGTNEVVADVILNWLFHLPALLFQQTQDGKPLFPSKDQLFHGLEIGAGPGYVLAKQLSTDDLSKTKPISTRNDAAQIGGNDG